MRLTWKSTLTVAGALGLTLFAVLLARPLQPGCGQPVLGRWSPPVFAAGVLSGIAGAALLAFGLWANPQRARKTGQGLLAAGISLGLTAGLLDVTFRLTSPPPSGQPPAYNVGHDRLGYFPAPGNRFAAASPYGEFFVQHTTDELGFIERGESLTPEPDATRILFIGDSLIRGFEVSAEDNLTARTAALLEAETGGPFQTLNTGVGSYSPPRYLLAYDEFAAGFDPDFVVVGVYVGNDFTDAVQLTFGNQLRYDDAGRPVAIHSAIDEQNGLVWVNAHSGQTPLNQTRPPLIAKRRWQAGLFSVARELLVRPYCERRKLADFDATTFSAADISLDDFDDGQALACRDTSGDLTPICTNYAIRNETLVRNNEDGILKDSYTEADLADIQVSLDALRWLGESAREDGRELLLVIFPVSTQVAGQSEGLKPVRGMLPGEVMDTTAPQDVLLAFCETEGLRCLDLLPLLKDHADERLFWTYDEHLTPRGHELVAEAIANLYLEEIAP